jgi:uncharacterized protein YneF (UPF0154 family)
MKYIACLTVGVIIGYYVGQTYTLEMHVEAKETDNG